MFAVFSLKEINQLKYVGRIKSTVNSLICISCDLNEHLIISGILLMNLFDSKLISYILIGNSTINMSAFLIDQQICLLICNKSFLYLIFDCSMYFQKVAFFLHILRNSYRK